MAKTLNGIVVSDKVDKAIVVVVSSTKTHPLYHKQYTTTKRYLVHDEKNEAKTGDSVLIVETRPMSARKHHKLDKITESPTLRDSDIVTGNEDVV